MKQYLLSFLRKFKLLNLSERINFLLTVFKNKVDNKKFLQENPKFKSPPYFLAYDAYGHTNWRHYETTGLVHSKFFSKLILKHHSTNSMSVLDWGCGPGRVIIHMPTFLKSCNPILFGCDYNSKTIKWCKSKINNICFEKNELTPPLAFQHNFFDVVYSLSVFTHLSASGHYQWLKELKRILKPGGIAIITLHGNFYRDKLLPKEKIRFDRNEIVIRDSVREGKRCYTAFHPVKYVEEQLFKEWHIVEHIPSPITEQLAQDVWVIRKY